MAAWWLGCQPRAVPDDTGCSTDPPEPGTVWVGEVCAAQVPNAGEGTSADLILANSRFRAIVRSGHDALTLRGVGGGTLVDATLWGSTDHLHELVPLVGGGWLDVESVQAGSDRVTVHGTVRRILPDRPADEGEPRTVHYVVVPDDPWLRIEGAEGFYLHPRGDHDSWGEALFISSGVALAADVTEVEDLGGAVFVDGASALLIAPGEESQALRAQPPRAPAGGQRITGTAPGATRLGLYAAERRVGTVSLTEDSFDTVIPAHVDGVQAERGGRAPSPRTAPGADLALTVGDAGSIRLVPATGSPPMRIDWSTPDGRSGSLFAQSNDRVFGLGAGVHQLALSAGPAYHPQTLTVPVAADEDVVLGVQLRPRFERDRWVLVAFDWPADRDRTFRGSNVTAAQLALASGVGYAVFASEDDVAGVRRGRSSRIPAGLAFRSGVWVGGEGFTVSAWPWNVSAREALHGGLQASGLDALDTAAALTGGPDDDRVLRVDLGWLARAGAPHLADPVPDFVALEAPGPDLAAWAPWFAWLDAERAVIGTGPHTWVPVTDPARFAAVDVEQPLFRGLVATGTGALLQLAVDGLPPGEVIAAGPSAEVDTSDTAAPSWVPVRPTPHHVEIELRNAQGLTDLLLVTTAGRVLQRWSIPAGAESFEAERTGLLPPGWLMAVAVSDDAATSAWAATGQVWIR
ncbi:MAG: hypothetical protein KTR31_11075 [Myxococcales bacterium]|nr:hypothetical protein [Myxococcales bacterium]